MQRSCRVERGPTAAHTRDISALLRPIAILILIACAACGETSGASISDASAAGGDAAIDSQYAQVEAILRRSCAYERCHAGVLIGAGLDLAPGGDYRAALIDRTACEYERMAIVEPGDPDHSWLMVKLTAPFRDRDDPYPFYIRFTPEPDWRPNERGCPDQTDDGTPLFGQRMPLTAPNMLPAADLDLIRAWILAGAPP